MNFVLIIAGIVFLFNPDFATIDILPDFIGIIFIIAGISKAADLNEKLSKARRTLTILAYVDAIKLLSVVILPFCGGNVMMWALLFTFCFAIGEGALGAVAFAQLFSGLVYIGMRYDVPETYNPPTVFTTVFICAKNLFSTLPFFAMLIDTQSFTGNEYPVEKKVFWYLGILMVLGLVFGICYLVVSLSYFLKVKHNKDFTQKIDEVFEKEINSNLPLVNYRALVKFMRYVSIAGVFLICFTLDGIDILPDFIAAALIAVGAFAIRRLYKLHARLIYIACGILFCVSLMSLAASVIFNLMYTKAPEQGVSFVLSAAERIYRDDGAYFLNILCIALDFLRGAAIIFVIAAVFRPIFAIIKEHVGVPITLTDVSSSLVRDGERRAKMRRFAIVSIALAVTAAALVAASRALLFFGFDGITVSPLSAVSGFAATAISAVYCLIGFIFAATVTEAVNYKYMF